jgi:hypothetical protein
MNVCLILNGYWDRTIWIRRILFFRYLFVGLGEEWNLQKKDNTRDEVLARILDAAAPMNKREDQLRQTIRDFRTRVAKFIKVDDGILEHSLWTATNLSFKHWIKIKIQLTVSNLFLYYHAQCFYVV